MDEGKKERKKKINKCYGNMWPVTNDTVLYFSFFENTKKNELSSTCFFTIKDSLY